MRFERSRVVFSLRMNWNCIHFTILYAFRRRISQIYNLQYFYDPFMSLSELPLSKESFQYLEKNNVILQNILFCVPQRTENNSSFSELWLNFLFKCEEKHKLSVTQVKVAGNPNVKQIFKLVIQLFSILLGICQCVCLCFSSVLSFHLHLQVLLMNWPHREDRWPLDPAVG